MKTDKANRHDLLASAPIIMIGAVCFLVAFLGSSGRSDEKCGIKSGKTIQLHPDNSHYFLWRGKPTILIGSNEHYGAVLNLDFDYDIYFDELKAKGLNYTRVFSGTYIEPFENIKHFWNIEGNTLGPASTRYICPWQRSSTPGFEGGGNKFDLSRFDPDYFTRLMDFVSKAGQHGVVVGFVFFVPYWEDGAGTGKPLPNMWARCPMKKCNNINGVGEVLSFTSSGINSVWDISNNDGLTPYMNDMVIKIVQELKDFDNVIFQPSAESYFGDGKFGNIMSELFDDNIISKIVWAEKDLPLGSRHLISQGRDPDNWSPNDYFKPDVSVLSFDAASASVVSSYYDQNIPIALDEITYKGPADYTYRRLGWIFIITGGAIYDMLDLSFTTASEDGLSIPCCIGGGSASLRKQLGILKNFMNCFDFIRMRPNNSIIKSGVPSGSTVRALVENGKQYAIYIDSGKKANLVLDIPAGKYRVEWVNPVTGEITEREMLKHQGGNVTLASPTYKEDVALRIQRVSWLRQKNGI